MTIHFQKHSPKWLSFSFRPSRRSFSSRRFGGGDISFSRSWVQWFWLIPWPRFTKTNQTNIVGLVQQGRTLWDEYLLKIPPNIPGYLHKTCKTQYRSIRLKIPRRPRRYYTRWFSHLRVSEGEPSGSMFNGGPCESDPFEGGWLHPLPPRFLISGVNKHRTHIHIELSNWGNWVKIQIQTS